MAEVSRWVTATPPWWADRFGKPNVEVVAAIHYDEAADQIEQLTRERDAAVAWRRIMELGGAASALAEQAETIQRLCDGLREIQEAVLKTWNYPAAAPHPDCPYYLGLIRGTAERCLSDERAADDPASPVSR